MYMQVYLVEILVNTRSHDAQSVFHTCIYMNVYVYVTHIHTYAYDYMYTYTYISYTCRNISSEHISTPASMPRNVSSTSLCSPMARLLHSHAMFDASRPCLYVCQRERRSAVLNNNAQVRGIYRRCVIEGYRV